MRLTPRFLVHLAIVFIWTSHCFSQVPGDGMFGFQADGTDGRVVVNFVLESSAAEKAGLRTGDVLLVLDGKELSGLRESELDSLMVSFSAEQVVDVVYSRAGALMMATVVMDKATEEILDQRKSFFADRLHRREVQSAMVPGQTFELMSPAEGHLQFRRGSQDDWTQLSKQTVNMFSSFVDREMNTGEVVTIAVRKGHGTRGLRWEVVRRSKP